MTQNNKLLLTAVFGPYGVKDKYAEALGCQMELLNNQITRCQGIHSPRQSYWSFGLYMIAENLDTPATILDFPKWEDFTKELKKGYTHVEGSTIWDYNEPMKLDIEKYGGKIYKTYRIYTKKINK